MVVSFILFISSNHYYFSHMIVIVIDVDVDEFFYFSWHLRAISIGWRFHPSFLGNLVLQKYFYGTPANNGNIKLSKQREWQSLSIAANFPFPSEN